MAAVKARKGFITESCFDMEGRGWGESWCVRVFGDYRCRGTYRKGMLILQQRENWPISSSPVSFIQLKLY